MNKAVRAAGFAAAAVALAAAGGISTPSQAEATGAAYASHYSAHSQAGMAETTLGMNDVDAQPADQKEARGNVLAQLWGHAVAAIKGEPAIEAAPAPPRPKTLGELVVQYAGAETWDREQDCLASAVYFEARGEPIEGQLAVAEVVLNRASSGKYPTDLCAVVEQPWQFSFVNRTGRIPNANRGSDAWKKAVAIAQIARGGLADSLPADVLWYHADYVAPVWGKRLNKQAKIGLHIFYS